LGPTQLAFPDTLARNVPLSLGECSPFGQELGTLKNSQVLAEKVFLDLYDPSLRFVTFEKRTVDVLHSRATGGFKPVCASDEHRLDNFFAVLLLTHAADRDRIDEAASRERKRFCDRANDVIVQVIVNRKSQDAIDPDLAVVRFCVFAGPLYHSSNPTR
jgi:hypothetical protein